MAKNFPFQRRFDGDDALSIAAIDVADNMRVAPDIPNCGEERNP
jgi:hypothetical protein